jgi:CHRD domain
LAALFTQFHIVFLGGSTMRSFNFVRFACCSGLALSLLAGAALASAQDMTQEPTEDMMMPQMMSMDGACPQGEAAMMLDNAMGMSATPMMSATEDMSMMMTETPMMSATEDMSMMGTEEAMGVKCLYGTFSGSAEVPGPGADGGSGFVFVSIDPGSGEVCYEEAVSGITLPASATHIHVNSAGLSGDVVVPFPVAPDADGKASGCTTITTEGLAGAIASNPEQYYVNVHTSDFPGGAVRAQLSAWDSSMMGDMGMMMTPGADMMSTPMAPEATVASGG